MELILGREKEIKWLEESVEQSLKGSPVFRFLKGTVGIGKTTLLNHATGYFSQKTPDNRCIATYQCLPSYDKDEKFRPWQSILGQLVTGATTDSGKKGFFSKLTGNKEQVLDVAAKIMNVVPGLNLASAAIEIGMAIKGDGGNPDDVKEQFNKYSENPVEFYAKVIIGLAKKKPTLILLDDIHLTDSASINVLNALMKNIVGEKDKPTLCIMGAYRTSESSAQDAGLESIASFLTTWGKRYVQKGLLATNELAPLDDDSIAKLINSELNEVSGLSQDAIKWLIEKASGSPFMTKRIVSMLKDENVLYLSEGKYTMSDDLVVVDGKKYEYRGRLLELARSGIFDDIESLFAEGLDKLTLDEVTTLKYASVQGLQFGSKPLAVSLQITEEETLEKLYSLSKKGLLKQAGEAYVGTDTHQTFNFNSNAFYKAVNKQLFDAQKRLIHTKLAKWYEDTFNSVLSAITNSKKYVGNESFKQDIDMLQGRGEEVSKYAISYYISADLPFSALDVYLKYAELIFEQLLGDKSNMIFVGPGDGDKRSVSDRAKLHSICVKIDRLIEDVQKRKMVDNVSSALLLEGRAYYIKAQAAEAFGDYRTALQNFALAEKSLGWIDERKLKYKILLDKTRCHIASGMYENARAEYHGVLQGMDFFKDSINEIADRLLYILKYEDARVASSLNEQLISKFKEYDDKTPLAKLIAHNIETALLEQRDEQIIFKMADIFMPHINNDNRDAIFKIFEDVPSIVTIYLSPDEEPASFGYVEYALKISHAALKLFDYMEFPSDKKMKVKAKYASFLMEMRNKATEWLSQFEEDEELFDQEQIEGLKTLIEGDSPIAGRHIIKIINEIDIESEWRHLIKSALDSALIENPEQLLQYGNKLINHYEKENDIEALIDIKSSIAGQLSNFDDYNGIDIEGMKNRLLSEAELLLMRYPDKMDVPSQINHWQSIGKLRCDFGNIQDGLNALIKALEMSKDNDDYFMFKTVYSDAEQFAKKAKNLTQPSKIKDLYEAAKDKLKKVEEVTEIGKGVEPEEFYADAETKARSYEDRADNNMDDADQALSDYMKAIELLDKVPNGKTYQDDIYERIAEKYKARLEAEEVEEKEHKKIADEMVGYYEKAYSINEDLMDYGRMIGINKSLMEIYESTLFDESAWFKRFLQTKDLALKTGDIMKLEELIEKVVPDYNQEFIYDESDCEEDEMSSSLTLPDDDLKAFYAKISRFFSSKGLTDMQENLKEGLIRYATRLEKPDLIAFAKG